MARHMARLVQDAPAGAILVPVPLHRWRIWSRGFNQSAMIARNMARHSGHGLALDALIRTRRTPPLYSLGRSARQRAVQGAFALRHGAKEEIAGRHVILVDDVWTTGATATNCARVLMRAGAQRVDIVCWSRTPAHEPD